MEQLCLLVWYEDKCLQQVRRAVLHLYLSFVVFDHLISSLPNTCFYFGFEKATCHDLNKNWARIPVSLLSIPQHPVALQIMFCCLSFKQHLNICFIWRCWWTATSAAPSQLVPSYLDCNYFIGCDLCPVFACYLFLSGLRLLQTTHYVVIVIKSPLHQAGLSSAKQTILVPAAARKDAACNKAWITCPLHNGRHHLFVSNKLF